jgi:hypothetical protein
MKFIEGMRKLMASGTHPTSGLIHPRRQIGRRRPSQAARTA